eukprot:UN22351
MRYQFSCIRTQANATCMIFLKSYKTLWEKKSTGSATLKKISDFRFPIFDFRFSISDFVKEFISRPPIFAFRFPIFDFRFPIFDFEISIFDFDLPEGV